MSYSTNRTSGWVIYAGVLVLIAASANLIYAITLLLKDEWIVLTREALLRFDLTTVGVILLAFALLQFFIAFGIFNGDLWARVLGIIGAVMNVLSMMSIMSVYPAWAWTIMIINGLVIYGLTVHGDEVAEI